MLVDNHLHIENRGNVAEGNFQNPQDYITQGRTEGVGVFGFSDHAYIFHEAKKINFNSWQEERRKYHIREYLSILDGLKKKQNQIETLIGLEIDYKIGKEEDIREFIIDLERAHAFDFFTGSVHWLGEWGFDLDAQEYEKEIRLRGAEKAFRQYFEIIEAMIKSQLFEVLGHIDLIKIFGAKSEKKGYIKEIAALLAKYDQAIEINTNGKNKIINELYPEKEFVAECCRKNVDITLGSDAHDPGRTGEYFNEAVSMLREVGYKRIAYFKKRERKYLEI